MERKLRFPSFTRIHLKRGELERGRSSLQFDIVSDLLSHEGRNEDIFDEYFHSSSHGEKSQLQGGLIMNSMTERVWTALANTEKHLRDYYRAMLDQRAELSGKAIGSVYESTSSDELERVLHSVEWYEYTHPEIMAGCIAAVADLPGRLGLVRLCELSYDTEVHLLDPKGTGKVSATVKGIRGRRVAETVLIMGPEKLPDGTEVEVVYTFHPGEPVRPSLLEAGEHAGKVLMAAEAIRLGFDLAKVE